MDIRWTYSILKEYMGPIAPYIVRHQAVLMELDPKDVPEEQVPKLLGSVIDIGIYDREKREICRRRIMREYRRKSHLLFE